MLGVWGAGGLGFFFLLEPSPGVPLTSPRWGFFFLVLRDSELFVPGEGRKGRNGGCQGGDGPHNRVDDAHL